MRSLAHLTLASAAAIVSLTLAACPIGKTIGRIDTGDAGPAQTITCNGNSDCPTDTPDCSFGVCKRPCAGNDACNDAATYCNVVSGYCEQGCRDSSTCAAGQVCSAGACVVGSIAASLERSATSTGKPLTAEPSAPWKA